MRKRKIIDLYEVREQTGEVGIEIEMEGRGLQATQHHGIAEFPDSWPWAYKQDGSLRGESCEWVLSRPVPRGSVREVLNKLWNARAKAGATFSPSRRCGVHIHMNVQDLTEEQVFVLAGTYIACEPLLVRFAGQDREGNLFCLRSSDARELIDALVTARQQGALNRMFTDQLRYASINFNSVMKYGSLEFRALGTPAEPLKIMQWIRMLYCVRDLSLNHKDLRELLYQLSAEGARAFIPAVFGPRSILRTIPDQEDLLKEGMRNMQDLLVTTTSAMRNNINLPNLGWHVFDPNDDRALRRWEQEQERIRLQEKLLRDDMLRPGRVGARFQPPPAEEDDDELLFVDIAPVEDQDGEEDEG